MRPMGVEVALEAQADLAEGPWWDAENNRLLWVDIFAGEIHLFDPSTGSDLCHHLGQPVGMVAARAAGGLVCAVQDGIGFVDRREGSFELVAPIEAGRPETRMNDGKCDPAGRLWAGTMAVDLGPRQGSLYRIDHDLSVTRAITEVSISNGLDWSPDGRTFYYVDSPTRRIVAFDYDLDTGTLGRVRTVVETCDRVATPDGLCVDSTGALWVAFWDGGCVRRYSASGELLASVELPVTRVTSLAFGGPALDQLFVTTARNGLSDEQRDREPLAGSIFVIDAGICGLRQTSFGDEPSA